MSSNQQSHSKLISVEEVDNDFYNHAKKSMNHKILKKQTSTLGVTGRSKVSRFLQRGITPAISSVDSKKARVQETFDSIQFSQNFHFRSLSVSGDDEIRRSSEDSPPEVDVQFDNMKSTFVNHLMILENEGRFTNQVAQMLISIEPFSLQRSFTVARHVEDH